jgi:hypothetical protein
MQIFHWEGRKYSDSPGAPPDLNTGLAINGINKPILSI